MVSPTLEAADLLLPVVLLQVGPVSPDYQGCNTTAEEPGGEMQMLTRR